MKYSLPLLAVVGTAFGSFLEKRDVTTINAALTSINGKIDALDTAVKAITSSSNPQAVIGPSNDLLNAIKAGTASITSTSVLTEVEAVQLAGQISDLATKTDTVVNDLIAKKDTIVTLGEGGTVLSSLTDQKAAAADFGKVLISKTPDTVKPVGDALNSQIQASLQKGIDAFTGTGGTPPPSGPSSTTGPSGTSSPSSGPSPTSNPGTGIPTVSQPVVPSSSTELEPCPTEWPTVVPPVPVSSKSHSAPASKPSWSSSYSKSYSHSYSGSPTGAPSPSKSSSPPPALYTAGAAQMGASMFALGIAAVGLVM
jgi:hypothetical protein